MNTPMKRCTKCGVEKPANNQFFNNDKSRKDHLDPHCKICKKSRYHGRRSLKTIERVQQLLFAKRLLERGFKICTKCGELKSATSQNYSFDKRSNNLISCCRKCEAAKNMRNAPDWIKRAKANGTFDYASRNESYKRYKKRNPEWRRFQWHKYQSRKLSLPSDFTDKDWQSALDYFHGCCAVCGCQLNDLFGNRPAQADHWIPMNASDCPGTVPTNIVPLCGQKGGCNQLKGTKRPDTWLINRFGKRKAKIILKRIEDYFDTLNNAASEN